MNTPAQCGVIKPPKTDIYSEAPYLRLPHWWPATAQLLHACNPGAP